jgi:hypothetical protein
MAFLGERRQMGISVRLVCLVLCLSGATALHADTPDGTAVAPVDSPVPQQNFLSSVKQAFKQDFDHQVVRGHFDVGVAPDVVHRYYCLVDAKSGRREPNGVPGEPVPRADGMTGIKATAVSVYGCASAEQQGILVTTGYLLVGGAAAGATAAATSMVAAPVAVPPVAVAPVVVARAAVSGAPADRVDVAGVKLGMPLDDVRAILKSKNLLVYHESMQTLGARAAGGRFVNVVAAWTPLVDGDAEAFTVMFTPVPGKERAMAIVHSMGYSSGHAVREGALSSGLTKKYGGYPGSDGLPAAPTWRVQHDGSVQVGDTCSRRDLFGGLADLGVVNADRPNLAMKTTPDEFRYQIDSCGDAIVTEDHLVSNAMLPNGERPVTRFTVTAYSPPIAFEGAAAAAQLMQTSGNVPHPRDAAIPEL